MNGNLFSNHVDDNEKQKIALKERCKEIKEVRQKQKKEQRKRTRRRKKDAKEVGKDGATERAKSGK